MADILYKLANKDAVDTISDELSTHMADYTTYKDSSTVKISKVEKDIDSITKST